MVWIGHDAIIAVGFVVTKDVASCTIVGGNPAKYIKDRFSSDEDMNKHLAYLNSLH